MHEFVAGGGWAGQTLPHGLASEALAMLRAVLNDFRSWGLVHTVTTLDNRIHGVSLNADRVITLCHEDYQSALDELVTKCDAALIIAPESDNILAGLSVMVERSGALLLGSGSAAVAVAGDKWECFRRFKEAALPTPDTWRSSLADYSAMAEEIGFPLVIKPVDGVGSEGVHLVPDISSLATILKEADYQNRDFLLQHYISGAHASVSLLVSSERALPLSLNEQLVRIGSPFVYKGSVVPLQHRQKQRALELAQRAVSLAPGLKGYVGVDMILTDRECYLIEINPRLTSSYVGLSQVINGNLAEAIWRACREDILPQEITLSGKITYLKEEFSAF